MECCEEIRRHLGWNEIKVLVGGAAFEPCLLTFLVAISKGQLRYERKLMQYVTSSCLFSLPTSYDLRNRRIQNCKKDTRKFVITGTTVYWGRPCHQTSKRWFLRVIYIVRNGTAPVLRQEYQLPSGLHFHLLMPWTRALCFKCARYTQRGSIGLLNGRKL